jgi:predicted outer membrane repeat protein
MLLSEAAVLNLTDTVISGNVAGGNGGGVATLLGSSMFASGLQMRDNLAGNHGGALFCGSATRLLLGGRSVVERNTAGLDGGAIYSLSDIMLTQGGQTTLRKNSAREGTGGALAVMESALRMAREHTLDASDNSAGKDGGAVALLGGGSIVLANEVVMNFSGNAAPGNGGAIYRDAYSCTSGRKCLFDELGGYHQVLRFSRNRAGRFGGAAHVACNSLSSRCWSQLGLGQDEEISQTLELHHNVAGFYGSGLSTAPSWIAWDTESGSRPRTVAPGVEVLNVTAKLYDHFGTVVKGTGAVVHFMICASKAEKCTPKSALLPSSAVSIDLQTGLSSAQLDVECLLGSDQVELSATSESAESSDLVVNMTVVCRCGAGQARKTISERQSWICTQCPPDFYVMDPNNHAHQCEKCPAGAVCSEKGVSGKLPESIWSADSETGRYILTSCPAGYSILNPDLHDAQMCMQCQPGWFCKGAADQALKCPTSTHSVEGATKFSDCVDVSFVEIMVTLPLAQFEFQDMQASFRTAIAAAAGTAADMVVISDFFQVDSRRGGDANRMLLSDSRHLDVTVRVAAESRLATIDIAERLNAETVNQNLVKEGIPPGLIKSEPKMIMNPKLPPEFPVVAVTLGIVSILAAVMFLTTIVLWNRWRKASRRLLGAAKGTVANQRDLPHELRGKYRAVKLLGQGGNSIILQVSQVLQDPDASLSEVRSSQILRHLLRL